MKRSSKSVLGVTLLEIMLVLAVAAMVIVMSIRYYRNATNAQRANTVLEQMQAIMAAAENLSQGASGFAAATTNNVKAIVGSANMTLPWNTSASVSVNGANATYYSIVFAGLDPAICTGVAVQLTQNPRVSNGATCGASTLTVYYDATK